MISIIALTYNNYAQLLETINSVAKDSSVETIVVNGEQWKDTSNHLNNHIEIVINEKDDDISDPFNKGILASIVEYIMILNNGDILLKMNYELVVRMEKLKIKSLFLFLFSFLEEI